MESLELEEFHSHLLRQGLSKSTADTYMRNVRAAFASYEDPVDKLLESQSPNYLHTIRASLRAWANFVEDTELLDDLSKQKLRLPPALRQKEKPPLTKREWTDLREEIENADYLPDPVRAELGMLANRGFRCGDVLRLKRKEAQEALRSGVLSFIGKGRKQLHFTVAAVWQPYLELLVDYTGWEYVRDLVAPSSPVSCRGDTAAKMIARSLQECSSSIGLSDVNPHLLRHTYATHFYRACQDPAKLQAHMQWSSIETAMRYVQMDNREELDAIAESLF